MTLGQVVLGSFDEDRRSSAEPAQADLVVVSSPLQYMNAIEWRRRRPEREVDLVLLGDRAGGSGAIDLLLARIPGLWRRIHRHARRPRARRWAPALIRDLADARHRASLRRLAARLAAGRYDAVVFGDSRNVSQRALVEGVPHDSLVLLDDGSITPQAARWRAGLAVPDPKRFSDTWFRTRVARAAFGDAEPVRLPAVTFFSVYARLIRPTLAAGDDVEPHAFEAWRSGVAARRGDDVWVLGANHVAAGITDAESYRRLILAGVAALRGAGFHGAAVYWPHRNEDGAGAAALAREAGLRLAASPIPVELAYLDASSKPAAVAVVASSAADTLSVIDPELELFRFGLPDGYLKRQRDHILAVVSAHDAFIARLRVLPTDARPGLGIEAAR